MNKVLGKLVSNFAVIFDMDGVLIDSVKYHWQAMNQVLAKYNIHIEDSERRHYIGQSVIHQLNQISEKFQTTLNIDTIIEELKPIKEDLQKGIQPKEGVEQLIGLLHENGIPIAIGTSSTTADTERKLTDAGIFHNFETLVTHDDITKHKPDPTVYLAAAKKLHIQPSQCIVIEDAPSGIEAAKRAGMKCIAITAVYTTDDDLNGADIIVHSLLEVDLKLLDNLLTVSE
ncbi:MAG: HAD family phosphatase [Candidatus Saccharimonadales bacterium]